MEAYSSNMRDMFDDPDEFLYQGVGVRSMCDDLNRLIMLAEEKESEKESNQPNFREFKEGRGRRR